MRPSKRKKPPMPWRLLPLMEMQPLKMKCSTMGAGSAPTVWEEEKRREEEIDAAVSKAWSDLDDAACAFSSR